MVDEFYAIAQRAMHLSALTAGESVPKHLLEAYRPLQDDEDEEEDAIAETDKAAEPSVAVTVLSALTAGESVPKHLLEAYRPLQDDEDEEEDAIAETDKAAEPSVAVTVASETIDVESYEREKA